VKALHATLGVGVLVSLVLGVAAEIVLRVVYGDEFAGASTALRILLPGSVLYAAAFVLQAGLSSLNRPFTAAAAQVLGLVVTVVGLLLFLREGGITAAAIVSTVAYSVVFVTALVLYRRSAGIAWRDFLTPAWAP